MYIYIGVWVCVFVYHILIYCINTACVCVYMCVYKSVSEEKTGFFFFFMNFPSHRIDQSTVSHQHLHMIIICCYKESLTQVLKNPGLFMCLVIDSPLLTMNCRSMISLLGRSNDQATTPGAAVGGKSTQKS